MAGTSEQSNKRVHLIIAPVTDLACVRPAPAPLAGEPNVMLAKEVNDFYTRSIKNPRDRRAMSIIDIRVFLVYDN